MIFKYVDSDCQTELCHNASLTHKFTETFVSEGYIIHACCNLCVIVFLYIIFLTVKNTLLRMDESLGSLFNSIECL